MRVTIIDGDLSYPPNSGKRLRTLNLMLPLARQHEITYIARCEPGAGQAEARQFLRDHGIVPVLVDAPLPTRKGAGFALGLGLNLLQSDPYAVVAHTHAAMRNAASAVIARLPEQIAEMRASVTPISFARRYCVMPRKVSTVSMFAGSAAQIVEARKRNAARSERGMAIVPAQKWKRH